MLGLESTARIITGAAAIMIAVFLGFATDPDITVKMMGVGMAVAVLIDATIVRLIAVPATMALLGRLKRWSPKWLDAALPDLAKAGPRVQDRTDSAGSLRFATTARRGGGGRHRRTRDS